MAKFFASITSEISVAAMIRYIQVLLVVLLVGLITIAFLVESNRSHLIEFCNLATGYWDSVEACLESISL